MTYVQKGRDDMNDYKMRDYKRIPFEHLVNCRDLGGYAGVDGKFFAYHKIYRADLPIVLDAQEWEQVLRMGVKTVIDLRSAEEQEAMLYTAPEEIRRFSYPLQKPGQAGEPGFDKSLMQQYEEMLEESPERTAHVLNLVGEHIGEGAVLYHCSVGKDRTGVISALIYLICGVNEYDIIADYHQSEVYLKQNKALWEAIPPQLYEKMRSPAENMERFLRLAGERDYLAILRKNGLRESAVAAIREAVLEA